VHGVQPTCDDGSTAVDGKGDHDPDSSAHGIAVGKCERR
jgi:hypothetical protein